jgi:hypothetical protein
MVGFRDLVGTGIAPVSKKTAVKRKYVTSSFCVDIIRIFVLTNVNIK